MSGIGWIKLRTDMFSDEKIRLIETLPEGDSILVIWVKLLALAGQKNMSGEIIINDEMPYTEEMLASIFQRKLNTVRMALECLQQFRMIEVATDRTIIITNWHKHQNIEGMDKIREQNLERQRRFRLKASEQRLALRNVTPHVTARDASRVNCVTSRPQKEKETKRREQPPIVPQGGTGEQVCASDLEAEVWLNELFGRKRAWSDEEERLLARLLPISAEDRQLIEWGYSLPRDAEGWALVDGARATKPKQSMILLLREFGSELDKWRSVKPQPEPLEESPTDRGWTQARRESAFQQFGEGVSFATPFTQLPAEIQQKIDAGVTAAQNPAPQKERAA